jgi:hypothetical protein
MMSTVFRARLLDATGRVVAEGDMVSALGLPADPEVRRFTTGNITGWLYHQHAPGSGAPFTIQLQLTRDTP